MLILGQQAMAPQGCLSPSPPSQRVPELGRAKFTGPLLNIPSSSLMRLGSTWFTISARTVAHSMEMVCTCAGASSRKRLACDARSISRPRAHAASM